MLWLHVFMYMLLGQKKKQSCQKSAFFIAESPLNFAMECNVWKNIPIRCYEPRNHPN